MRNRVLSPSYILARPFLRIYCLKDHQVLFLYYFIRQTNKQTRIHVAITSFRPELSIKLLNNKHFTIQKYLKLILPIKTNCCCHFYSLPKQGNIVSNINYEKKQYMQTQVTHLADKCIFPAAKQASAPIKLQALCENISY